MYDLILLIFFQMYVSFGGALMLINEISFCSIFPMMNMKCPVSSQINSSWRYILLHSGMAISACSLENLFPTSYAEISANF